MLGAILAAISAQARERLRKFGQSATLAVIAGLFALIALGALLAALFFELETLMGALRACLTIAGGALLIAVAVSFPLWRPRRRPPPPAPEPTLTQFVALMAKGAPTLSPRQLALGAVLMALALGLMTAAKSEGKPDD